MAWWEAAYSTEYHATDRGKEKKIIMPVPVSGRAKTRIYFH